MTRSPLRPDFGRALAERADGKSTGLAQVIPLPRVIPLHRSLPRRRPRQDQRIGQNQHEPDPAA